MSKQTKFLCFFFVTKKNLSFLKKRNKKLLHMRCTTLGNPP